MRDRAIFYVVRTPAYACELVFTNKKVRGTRRRRTSLRRLYDARSLKNTHIQTQTAERINIANAVQCDVCEQVDLTFNKVKEHPDDQAATVVYRHWPRSSFDRRIGDHRIKKVACHFGRLVVVVYVRL